MSDDEDLEDLFQAIEGIGNKVGNGQMSTFFRLLMMLAIKQVMLFLPDLIVPIQII